MDPRFFKLRDQIGPRNLAPPISLDGGFGKEPGSRERGSCKCFQRLGSPKRTKVAHDTAIYRACRKEHRRLLERGAAIRRVRLDGELKSTVARRSESARARDGWRAAEAGRHHAARQLELLIDAEGGVLFPDAADRVHRLRRADRLTCPQERYHILC